ncbi:Argonaute family protein [Rhynchospora pubera]|uniref:Argonaute family protein n=1 Tax=Rhynchospora pubera TaxID=906938 RepID=A0AAV8F2C5_9POAL|nr:Argonaute family protein [Rhynchospora pubera]
MSSYQRGRGAYGRGGRFHAGRRYDNQDEGPTASSNWRRPSPQRHPESGGSSTSSNWRRLPPHHHESGGSSTSSNWRRPPPDHPEKAHNRSTTDPTTEGPSAGYVGLRGQRGGYMGPSSQQRHPPRELPLQIRAPPRVEQEAAGLEVQISQLAIQPATQPSSGSTMEVKLPSKPGRGTRGEKLRIKANHFLVELPEKELQVDHYNVVITHAGTDRPVISLETNRAVMSALVRAYRESYLGSRGMREFEVKIVHVGTLNMKHLEMFLAGRRPNAPQDTIQALDIVLAECLSIRDDIVKVERSFFSDSFLRINLGGGLEMWGGFYQTLHPTQMGLSLNLDTTAKAFYQSRFVLGYVSSLTGRDLDSEVLTPDDIAKVRKNLKGVKVVVTHQGNIHRKYRISGLTAQATRNLTFSCNIRGTITRTRVVDHFRETYNYTIRYLNLPCLEVGSDPKRPIYLPMEVNTNNRAYERDNGVNFSEEFGLSVSERTTTIQARVLPTPVLKYHNLGAEKECKPTSGVWNMRNKKLVNGGKVNFWYCISFSPNIGADIAGWFCNNLGDMCRVSGMEFTRNPILPHTVEQSNKLEAVLKSHYQEATDVLSRQNKTPDLLIVILPDKNGNLYGDVKRICETEIGLVTQCCLAKHVKRANPQMLANLALKINVKVGGKNTVLADVITREVPVVRRLPTIIFGADVTHPLPGEDTTPSIAAVVASQDWPDIATYVGLYRVQGHRQEIISHLGEMVKEHLMSFRRKTNYEPAQIIFYRDGVSDGQFHQVLQLEINAIRTACKQLSPDYMPAITFIVVQKRHHTRLFPYDYRAADRSGNVPPGTVVDTQICHPTEFDFFLCSHAGIKGTSSPTHYHVLWDDNRFSVDDLQTLTYNLCYTYARCTRSVSIVPPAYYAHHFASRARLYYDSGMPDSGSFVAGPSASRDEASSSKVKQLPAVKDNVKNVMFYC